MNQRKKCVRNRLPGFPVLLLLCALGSTLSMAADAPFSGPQAGEKLMPLKVALAYGTSKGTEIDLVQAAAGRPTLLVLVQGANRPAARLTRILLNYAEMRSQDGLYAAAVWLADDRSGAEQYLQQAVSWWGVGVPVGVSLFLDRFGIPLYREAVAQLDAYYERAYDL